MKLGLFGINIGVNAAAAQLRASVRAAADAGFDSVWAGEHVVLPDPRVAPSPMAPTDPLLDPVVALTLAAAESETLRLGTGIIILPQRNPVVLAKELASLDVVSGGRLMLGVGAGYLEPEFAAVGANFPERGAVTDEHLDAIAHLWYDEHPAYHGRFVDFAAVDAHPRPVQRPVPVLVGGHSPAAFRRAAQRGQGWFGFALDVAATRRCLEGLRAAGAEGLEISVTPRGRLSGDVVAEFAALGVHRLVVSPPFDGDAAAVMRTIEIARAAVDAAT